MYNILLGILVVLFWIINNIDPLNLFDLDKLLEAELLGPRENAQGRDLAS